MSERDLPTVAGMACHVVHHGNDGSPCFLGDEDYLVYLDCLKGAAEQHGCAIHAYVLMPDHVQLLVSLDSETRVAQLMRCVGDRYLEYVNYTCQRNGAFREHESRVTSVDNDRELLARYCAIEAEPVRACLVAAPTDYRWSSHRHHACGSEDAVIQDHASYLALGTTQLARQLAYNELFRAAAGIKASTGLDPAPGVDLREDGIKRSVRGLAWQAMRLRERRIGRSQPPEEEAHARGTAPDMAQARSGALRQLANK
ncbi:MAG TPA: transposase [Burkholderiales bacterium]